MSTVRDHDDPLTARSSGDRDIWALTDVLWRRRRVVAAISLAFLIIGVVAAFARPRSYRAVALLRVAPGGDILPMLGNYLAGGQTQAAANHITLIKRPEVIKAALARLTREQRASFPPEPRRAPVGVTVARDTTLIEIAVTATDQPAAVALANAVAQTYVKSVERSNSQVAAAIAKSLESESALARKRYERAQERLATARKETGIYDSADNEYTRTLGSLAEVRQSSPGSLVKTGIADVQVEAKGQQAALDESERLLKSAGSAATPDLRGQVNSYRVGLAASQAKLSRLAQEEAALEGRLARLNKLAPRLVALETDAATQKGIAVALESKVQKTVADMAAQLSTVQVASPAQMPAQPTGLPRRLQALAGLVVGAFLGAGVALAMEAVELRRVGRM